MIMSGSSMPGSGPTSDSNSHGEVRRRAKRKRNHWCARDSTWEPRALTRKEAAGMVTRRTGSENQRACRAGDGSLRGISRASDRREWYLQTERIVFQASQELHGSEAVGGGGRKSGRAKRARSPSSFWSSSAAVEEEEVVVVEEEPSTGIRMWNWT